MTPQKVNLIFSIIQRSLVIIILIIIGFTIYEITYIPKHNTISSIVLLVSVFMGIGVLMLTQEDKERRFRFRLWLSKSYRKQWEDFAKENENLTDDDLERRSFVPINVRPPLGDGLDELREQNRRDYAELYSNLQAYRRIKSSNYFKSHCVYFGLLILILIGFIFYSFDLREKRLDYISKHPDVEEVFENNWD